MRSSLRFVLVAASLLLPRVALAGDTAPPESWVGGGEETEDGAALPQLPPPTPAPATKKRAHAVGEAATRAASPLAGVQRAIVEGRLVAAREELDALAVAPDEEVRAAAVELRAIVEAWIARGGRGAGVAIVSAAEAPSPWKDSFDAARLALASGDHRRAAWRFRVLTRTAPDPLHAAKARALGDLATALADEGDVPEAPPPPAATADTPQFRGPPKKRWYGWQTLVADGASFATVPLGGVGVAGYLLAAPIVHAAHGRWGVAAADLGMRVGLPVVGCGFGVAIADGDGYEDLAGCALMGALGIVGAITIDAAVLAREDVKHAEKKEQAVVRPKAPAIAWSPAVTPRKEGGVSVGIGGVF